MPKKPKKKKSTLRPKQSKVLAAIAKGVTNNSKASKKAGYKQRDGVNQAINSRLTQEAFQALGDKIISDVAIFNRIAKAMNATQETKFGTVDDTHVQIMATKLAAQLKGRFIERHDLTGTIDVNVEISARTLAKKVATGLAKWWADFKKDRAKPHKNCITEEEIFITEL